VGIATRLCVGRFGGSNPDIGERFFSGISRPTLRPNQLLFNGHRCSVPRLRRPGRKVNHSTPSSAEFTNEWSCNSAPPICLYIVDRKSFS